MDVRIRKMSKELHTKLKIKAIQEQTTLEKLMVKILSESIGVDYDN